MAKKEEPPFKAGNVVRYVGKERRETLGGGRLWRVDTVAKTGRLRLKPVGSDVSGMPPWVKAEEVEMVAEKTELDEGKAKTMRLESMPAPKQSVREVGKLPELPPEQPRPPRPIREVKLDQPKAEPKLQTIVKESEGTGGVTIIIVGQTDIPPNVAALVRNLAEVAR